MTRLAPREGTVFATPVQPVFWDPDYPPERRNTPDRFWINVPKGQENREFVVMVTDGRGNAYLTNVIGKEGKPPNAVSIDTYEKMRVVVPTETITYPIPFYGGKEIAEGREDISKRHYLRGILKMVDGFGKAVPFYSNPFEEAKYRSEAARKSLKFMQRGNWGKALGQLSLMISPAPLLKEANRWGYITDRLKGNLNENVVRIHPGITRQIVWQTGRTVQPNDPSLGQQEVWSYRYLGKDDLLLANTRQREVFYLNLKTGASVQIPPKKLTMLDALMQIYGKDLTTGVLIRLGILPKDIFKRKPTAQRDARTLIGAPQPTISHRSQQQPRGNNVPPPPTNPVHNSKPLWVLTQQFSGENDRDRKNGTMTDVPQVSYLQHDI